MSSNRPKSFTGMFSLSLKSRRSNPAKARSYSGLNLRSPLAKPEAQNLGHTAEISEFPGRGKLVQNLSNWKRQRTEARGEGRVLSLLKSISLSWMFYFKDTRGVQQSPVGNPQKILESMISLQPHPDRPCNKQSGRELASG